MNGNVFDESLEDHFSVIGSSDESEPEHGLTDSDSDNGEDERDEGERDLSKDPWFDLDDLESEKRAKYHWPVRSLPASHAAMQSAFCSTGDGEMCE